MIHYPQRNPPHSSAAKLGKARRGLLGPNDSRKEVRRHYAWVRDEWGSEHLYRFLCLPLAPQERVSSQAAAAAEGRACGNIRWRPNVSFPRSPPAIAPGN